MERQNQGRWNDGWAPIIRRLGKLAQEKRRKIGRAKQLQKKNIGKPKKACGHWKWYFFFIGIERVKGEEPVPTEQRSTPNEAESIKQGAKVKDFIRAKEEKFQAWKFQPRRSGIPCERSRASRVQEGGDGSRCNGRDQRLGVQAKLAGLKSKINHMMSLVPSSFLLHDVVRRETEGTSKWQKGWRYVSCETENWSEWSALRWPSSALKDEQSFEGNMELRASAFCRVLKRFICW